MQNYRLERSFTPWLLSHIKEFWAYYIGAMLSLATLHFSQSTLPVLSKELGEGMGAGKSVPSVWWFICLALLIILFRTLSRLLFFYPARLQQKLLRMELLDKLQSISPYRYVNVSTGQLFQIMFNDFNGLRGFVGFALLQVGNIVLALGIFLPKLSAFDSSLLLSLTPLFLAVVLFSIVMKFFRPYNKQSMDYQGDVQNFLIESYQGRASIKNFHCETSFGEEFQKISSKELKAFFMANMGPTISSPLIRLGMGLSLVWGGKIIFAQGLGAGALVFYSGFLFLLLEPLMFLSWIGIITIQSLASWKRIKELWNGLEVESKYEKIQKDGEQFLFDFWGSLINIKITQHHWTLFAGETGVGKSVLLKWLAHALKSEGKKIFFVAQSPHLYNDTVENNLFLGEVPTPERKDLALDLLKLFSLEVLAQTKEELFSLEVGENGKKLSGGQAKRLCLVRSLLSEADYYLWDDPFSSIDLIYEKQIVQALKAHPLYKGKTFILSGHRISTVTLADELCLLARQNGIAAQGPSTELLKSNEEVRKYFEKQHL